jgi:hypothetical protein
MNTPKIKRILTLSFAVAGFTLLSGLAFEVNAQRDPFAKPGWARTKTTGPGGTAQGGPKKPGVPDFVAGIPSIEQRIEYYKRQREDAATNGQPLPKVTSVLALEEMQVTGIFRTPRGYAAMVEATPIRLSYTIYPGEKFFDGQLVAVEENRLVFRKVTKVGKNKFATTVENKPLRKYTQREVIQGTAPAGAESADAKAAPAAPTTVGIPAATSAMPMPSLVSPLDEMNNMPEAEAKPASGAKRTVRSARKN